MQYDVIIPDGIRMSTALTHLYHGGRADCRVDRLWSGQRCHGLSPREREKLVRSRNVGEQRL